MKKTILIVLLFLSAFSLSYAQTKVTGKVTSSDDGNPLSFATVVVKGTSTSVVTDNNGNYSITVPNGSNVLVFSFMGYKTVEENISGRNLINVILSADANLLDESTITVAYQTVKKSSFTGSAAAVKKSQLENIQTANLTRALEGAVAGVQVTGVSGQPGAVGAVRIRGIGSINASSAPLYIVDGAPYDGDLNAISMDDIENITVLKDAAAAALYGSRAANGVLLVTTKKGRDGKPIVNAKINVGWSNRAIPEYNRVSPEEYYELMYEGWVNALTINKPNWTPEYISEVARGDGINGIVRKLGGYNPFNVPNGEVIGTDGKLNPSARLLYADDWQDAITKTGLRQDYSASISGGNEKSTYFASIGYFNEEGYVIGSNFERFNGRVGTTSKVTRWFKTEANIAAAKTSTNNFLAKGTYTSNPFYYARVMGPIYPVYQRNADGSIKKFEDGSPIYDMGGGNNMYTWAGHRRPYAANSNLALTLPIDTRGNERSQISARFSGEFTFLQDFNLKIMGSTDISNTYYTIYQNRKFGDAEGVLGRLNKYNHRNNSYTFNQVLTYNKYIDKHHINVLLGHENYQYKFSSLDATRTGFTVDIEELIAGSVAEGSFSYSDIYRIESYFGQLAYSFDNKYFLSASFRSDGSSKFHKDSRWGTFWSVGGSWRMKQEDFLTDVQWVDDLKFKASYGEQGNDGLLDANGYLIYYPYKQLFTIDKVNNGLENGTLLSQLPNPNLVWEKNANLNVGLEFSFLQRIRGSVEYFSRESNNLLFTVPRPQSTGISGIMSNIGTMKNSGFEIQVAADIIKNDNIIWTLDINATTFSNEITAMPKDQDGKYQEIISGTKKRMVGRSIYDFWMKEYAGVDPSNGDALYYMDKKDANGNVIGRTTTNNQNAASYYYVGSAIPDLIGGITNTVRYKGFDLSVLIAYQIGGKLYDSNYRALMHPGSFGTHWSSDIKNRWTPTNTNTDVPRLQNGNAHLNVESSRYLINASFLSFRNVTLGYTIPSKYLSKLEISNARVFVTADNLYLFSKRKGMDPQQSVTGVSDNTYIPNRYITIGLNLSF